MPPSEGNAKSLYYLSGNSSSNDGDVCRLQLQSSEEEEEVNYNDARSQVRFDTYDIARTDF
jgi:hypothetical protein